MKVFVRGTVLVVAMAILMGCGRSYRGAATEGWVIDEATKQPLSDVIVVIHWPLERGGFHPGMRGRLFAQETTTDASGRFSFPEWGPLRPKDGYLSDLAPYLAFFKRGYEPLGKYDPYRRDKRSGVRVSALNGKTVALKPFNGSFEDYVKTVNISSDLFLASFGICDWEQFPRMTSQLVKLGDECRARGLFCGLPIKEGLRGSDIERCSDPEKIFGANNNDNQGDNRNATNPREHPQR